MVGVLHQHIWTYCRRRSKTEIFVSELKHNATNSGQTMQNGACAQQSINCTTQHVPENELVYSIACTEQNITNVLLGSTQPRKLSASEKPNTVVFVKSYQRSVPRRLSDRVDFLVTQYRQL